MDHQIANKDEADKCLRIAKQALDDGHFIKAARFAEKAQRLYPSPTASSLLNDIAGQHQSTSTANNTPSSSQAAPGGMGSTPGLRSRAKSPIKAQKKQETHDDEDHKATPEQRQLVATIVQKTCYYEILSIQKAASDDDIKKSYRKLALKLHPDKNKARGADEAFKKVSRAFSCLSDPDKRHIYNTYGVEDPSQQQPTSFRRATRSSPGFRQPAGGMHYSASEIDPEEIFNMFFFGGNPFMAAQQRAYQHRRAAAAAAAAREGGGGGRDAYARQQQQRQQQSASNPLRSLFPLVPFFLVLLLNFLTSPGKPAFQLTKTRGYAQKMQTMEYEVPFYVASHIKFAKNYPPKTRERNRLEKVIEEEYKQALNAQCSQERMIQQRYKYFGQHEKARAVQLKSCEELVIKFGKGKKKSG
jgi:DnaJ homolog subfamily B member 12